MKVEHEGDQVLSFSEAWSTADEYEECEKRAEDEGATAENFLRMRKQPLRIRLRMSMSMHAGREPNMSVQ